MKKELIQGIPFWLDAQQRVFAFEGKEVPANPLWLGTYNPQSQKLELRADWQTAYQEKLAEYRRSCVPRARVPAAST
jgi:hypothetical protein